MKYLTELQIKKYENDGFLLLKKFFSKEEMEPIIKSINKFSGLSYNSWEAGKEMAYYETSNENENERILCRIEKYVDFHPEFQKLANSKKVLSILEDLMGGPCILFKDKINFKRTGGGGFRPHQDVQARWDEFVKYTMSVMISTDRSTPENGCLEVAPGQHKRGLIGNIKSERFKDIWAGNQRKDTLNNLDVSKCPHLCVGDNLNEFLDEIRKRKVMHPNFL